MASVPWSAHGPTVRVGRILPMKYGILIIAVIIVFILLILMLMRAWGPPVDVYSKPTPSSERGTLFHTAHHALRKLVPDDGERDGIDYTSSKASYQAGIVVEVSKFTSSNSARSCVSSNMTYYSSLAGTYASGSAGDRYWFTFSGSALSVFVWQKDIWVFEVSAWDDSTRDMAADELPVLSPGAIHGQTDA